MGVFSHDQSFEPVSRQDKDSSANTKKLHILGKRGKLEKKERKYKRERKRWQKAR